MHTRTHAPSMYDEIDEGVGFMHYDTRVFISHLFSPPVSSPPVVISTYGSQMYARSLVAPPTYPWLVYTNE